VLVTILPTKNTSGGGGNSWLCVVFTGTSGGTSSFEQLEKNAGVQNICLIQVRVLVIHIIIMRESLNVHRLLIEEFNCLQNCLEFEGLSLWK